MYLSSIFTSYQYIVFIHPLHDPISILSYRPVPSPEHLLLQHTWAHYPFLSLFQPCPRYQLALCSPPYPSLSSSCVSFPVPDVGYMWSLWCEELSAMPPELEAMCLRWDLAHVVRFSGGNADHLSMWRRKHSGHLCLTEPEATRQAHPKPDCRRGQMTRKCVQNCMKYAYESTSETAAYSCCWVYVYLASHK